MQATFLLHRELVHDLGKRPECVFTVTSFLRSFSKTFFSRYINCQNTKYKIEHRHFHPLESLHIRQRMLTDLQVV